MAKPPRFRQVIFRMPRADHAALKARAEAEDRTMSMVVRRALRRYLERPPA